MRQGRIVHVRPIARAFCVFGLLLLFGCSTGPKRVPASGTIELDGRPLEAGILVFDPDVAKGNTARVSCTSPVHNGHFDVQTAGVERSDTGPGIPLGWYKVSIRANRPGVPPTFPGQPVLDIDAKYLNPDKTTLEIEIVENPAPGAYDLKVTKQAK